MYFFVQSDKEKVFESDESGRLAAKRELNTLAQMIGGDGASGGKSDKFTLSSLFPDTDLGGSSGKEGNMGEVRKTRHIFCTESNSGSQSYGKIGFIAFVS